MKVEKKAPKLRFKGFTDDWEQCKLGDVCVERNQKTVLDKNYPLCSFIAHKGVVPKAKYDRSFLVKSDNKKYKRTELNDFIYSSNNLETGSIGLNKFGNATISPVYSVFMVNGNSDFIAGLATTPRFIYEMIRFRQGVVYGQWRIHESDFLKIKHYIPQVLEQEKIGNVLSELDRTITLHEEKKKQLESLKSALLQKLFADKSGYPIIRFKGYSDAWEQRKVSELFRITRGYVLAATQTETTKTDEKPYPVYSSQTKDKGLMGYYKDYLYEDAITWTTDGANAGTVNYRAGKFYCTNVCGVLLSNEVKANQMIAEALNNVAKGYVSYVGNPKLMNNVMADIVIQIPTQAEEREQLSTLFASLDHFITLHQHKIDNLKRLKRALLQKMFV